ncbi:MAG: NEW3 domain-containing protein [Candidatus Aenigmatarchaeota archaeon]
MEENKLLLVLLIAFVLISSLYIISSRLSGMFIGWGTPSGDFDWWNVSWHYRIRLEINSTGYDRVGWPIEKEINFTDLLPSGTFDENSTRIYEYNSTGGLMYEVPSQFDRYDSYDSSSNAVGTLAFIMNGTTQVNTKRIFYVYYDSIENGAKNITNYTSAFSYNYTTGGKELNVNNSNLAFWIDTMRGENTSGLYRVRGMSTGNDIWYNIPGSNDKTIEYMQYSNGTYNFSFDFRNNATVKYNGPARLVVEQRGNETLWNSSDVTEGFAVKRYVFYKDLYWIKIETNFTNTGGSEITRNSTFAGAIAFDIQREYGSGWLSNSNFGDMTPPGWWYGTDAVNNYHTGIIHINQSGTSNFWVPNCSQKSRIGIDLNTTAISSGSSITEVAAVHFNDTQGDYNQVQTFRDMLVDSPSVNQTLPERWYVLTSPSTNESIYNRNESILIVGSVSSNDPYGIVGYMNATIDMGTVSSADDQTIILYDDGTHGDLTSGDKAFANEFSLASDSTVGIWSINFTTYTNNSEFLNSTGFSFNVTDVLNVTVNVTTKKPLTSGITFANIYVRNYRIDSWLYSATINCTFNSVEVLNKSSYSNGTYSVNFTAPALEGSYDLYCNATQDGNFGNASDNFTAETAKINVSIDVLPQTPSISNITLYNSSSFNIAVNATNIGNGTAYASNISLDNLNGWGADSISKGCGDIEKVSYCDKPFNITVPAGTPPGNYYINVTVDWRNPDGTPASNETQINVTVESNPRINVVEDAVSSQSGDGTWNDVGNFTVSSIGNDNLANITFSCYSGAICNDFTAEFNPVNISYLNFSLNQSVSINVTIPLNYTPGTYTGNVNVSSQNGDSDSFTINVTVPAKTNLSMTRSIANYTAYNVTKDSGESFVFSINLTNVGDSSARAPNVTLSAPVNWTLNSSIEYCTNLTRSAICSKSFNVTIPQESLSGSYLVNITANWTQNDNTLGTNSSFINVTVASNPMLNVSQLNVSGSIPDGTMNTLGNFTVLSIGNGPIQNVTFACLSGTVCENFTIGFIPTSISSLNVNSNQSVAINVSVPLGFLAGTYSGTVNVSAQNANYNTLTVFVTVPSNRTWTMNPTFCERSEYPDEGTACEATVINNGNDVINFSITPENGNHTTVNVTNFTVGVGSNYTYNVTYNVTNITQAAYNSLFTVDAVQSGSSPDNMSLNVSLLPYLPPFMSINIIPNSTDQNSTVEIFANVTDRSSSGISWVNISIAMPDGTVNQTNMTFVNQSGNFSQWYYRYPDAFGSTMQRGLYNVTVSAGDNIGNIGNVTSNFSIYVKLLITSTTMSDRYLQGDTGSIYYVARNMSGSGLENTNVSFMLKDPTNNISFYTERITNSEGALVPMPSFILPSDALTGNYTLLSNTTYYDSDIGSTVYLQKTSNFQVQSRTITVTGLFADIETAVVWYPNNTMRIGMLIYNGEGRPVDPTAMNLTMYDPDNAVFFSVGLSQMTKASTGYYTYQRTLSQVTPSGMYLAVLNVSQNEFSTMKLKAFRVAHGGPYDVWLNLFENEVPQGDYLDFAVNIENKGEVTQDVIMDYWVSSQNITYYSNTGQAVLTPALSNQSFTRSAFIDSTQSMGTYTLNVRVSYDSLQQPIVNSVTFSVTAKTTPIPPNVTPPAPQTTYVYPSPSGGVIAATPNEKISASLIITSYNSNISLSRNFTKIESVTVKNNGVTDLTNVSIYIIGLPLTWFKIVPERYNSLRQDNSSIFLIEFNIPQNAKPDDYKANLIATSGVVSDQKEMSIKVYQSMEELVISDLRKLRDSLQELYIDTKIAEKEGKDVSIVMSLYNEAKSKLDGAEVDLTNGSTPDALDKVSNASKLIKRARDLLDGLEVVRTFDFSLWIVFGLFAFLILAVIIIVILWRKKKLRNIRPYIIPLIKLVESVKHKKVSREDAGIEKEKLNRMLNIVEKEKEQGILTGSSYEKMKKSIQEKLSKLEKK